MPMRPVLASLVVAVVLLSIACAEERFEPKGTIAPLDVAAPPADAGTDGA